MSDLSQESPLWREWAESRHSVQQMRDEIDRLRAENARLIAAAPELVEALKEARDCVVSCLNEEENATYPNLARAEYHRELLAKVDAALAKAGVL